MIDLHLVRNEPEAVRANLARRKRPEVLELFEQLRIADARQRQLGMEVDQLRAFRNTLAAAIPRVKSGQALGETTIPAGVREALRSTSPELAAWEQLPPDVSHLKALAAAVGPATATAEAARDAVAAQVAALHPRVPNLLDASVPYGGSDADNVVVRTWGTPDPPRAWARGHAELAEAGGLADFERAARASGAGFNYLLGDLVLLDLALQRYALEFLSSRGYTPVSTPMLLRRGPYEGVTDLSDFETVMYRIADDDLYLIATSEHPIAARFMGEILDDSTLPMRLAGLSSCFRREIGGHGVDQKGLFRMHQFNKVEQFIFCRPEESWALHEELLANTEGLYQGLQIPYRVVNVCTGDIGTVAAKKYDVEAWFAKQQAFREVASCSNCTDYQARRLKIRAGKQGGSKVIAHTLNNTAIATSRAMVAILEQYQRQDGTVAVPSVLQPYMGSRSLLGAPLPP